MALRRRSSLEWQRLIDDVTDINVRSCVACIVWWDFYSWGSKPSPVYFSKYLYVFDPGVDTVKDSKFKSGVAAALISLGYDKCYARERVRHLHGG